ncbi:MAG: DUF4386 domain-containing protein [Desulfobacterales bacterium]|nr:DUF4386 domain-containing protein [Desulfobacterales bacterium]
MDIVAMAILLSLITLSQLFVDAGMPEPSYYQTMGDLSLSGFHWVVNVCKLMAFSIGALLYYSIFYRTKMIPRWLSAWGIIAVSTTIVSAVLVVYSAVAPFSLRTGGPEPPDPLPGTRTGGMAHHQRAGHVPEIGSHLRWSGRTMKSRSTGPPKWRACSS